MEDRDALLAALNAADNEIDCLRQQVADLQQQVRDCHLTIQQAKDITPVLRPSFRRVLVLVRAAFFNVVKIPKIDGGGWFLEFGRRRGKFKTLRQIWDLFNVESWNLNDLLDLLDEDKYVAPVKKNIKEVPWSKFKPAPSLETAPFDVTGLISLESERLEFDIPFG